MTPVTRIDLSSHAEFQLRNGRAFILDAPTTIPAHWGATTDVLWAEGEALMVTGPQGVGKSTFIQQLMLARHGITDPSFLGFPVAPTSGLALYIAADRPRQIARSLRRMVTEEHAELLEQRLRVWQGPLPFNLVKEPQKLAQFAQTLGAKSLYIDSLKKTSPGRSPQTKSGQRSTEPVAG